MDLQFIQLLNILFYLTTCTNKILFYSQRWPLQFIGPTDDGSRGQVPGSYVSGRCKKSDEHFGQCGISGNMQTIQERGVHMPEIQKIPERYHSY